MSASTTLVKVDLTAKRLRELLEYDQETGIFSWKQEPSSKTKIGARAGSFNAKGYGQIGLDGRMYRTNRLAVLYMTGNWPVGVVDHRNGDVRDDAWDNLRDVPSHVNQQNMRRPRADNSTGFLGVIRAKNRFAARIRAEGRVIYQLIGMDRHGIAERAARWSIEQMERIRRIAR